MADSVDRLLYVADVLVEEGLDLPAVEVLEHVNLLPLSGYQGRSLAAIAERIANRSFRPAIRFPVLADQLGGTRSRVLPFERRKGSA